MSDVDSVVRLSLTVRRMALGLTQRDLAARTGIAQSAISALETGKSNPQVTTLSRWAEGLGMKLTMGLEQLPEPVATDSTQAGGEQP
jgi:transcriptional regulator with XRE-family HTH domain